MIKKIFATKDGSQIAYDLYPKEDAPTVVLLHGNGGTRHYFDKQMQIYKEHFKIIALDSRGHGQSSNAAEKLSFDLIAHDIYEIVVNENVKQATLIGFSDGANAAMVFAVHYPSLVGKLVLNAGNMRLNAIGQFNQQVDRIRLSANQAVGKLIPKFQRKANIQSLLTSDLPISWQSLSTIKAPTLVIAGEKDVIAIEHTTQIAQHIPNSKLMIIPDGYHSFGRKNPLLFAQVATDFITTEGAVK
jgi:pimeloyl-ACP methyl ester carboxylesterase